MTWWHEISPYMRSNRKTFNTEDNYRRTIKSRLKSEFFTISHQRKFSTKIQGRRNLFKRRKKSQRQSLDYHLNLVGLQFNCPKQVSHMTIHDLIWPQITVIWPRMTSYLMVSSQNTQNIWDWMQTVSLKKARKKMMEAVVKMKNPSMTRKEKKSTFFPIWLFFIIFDSEIRMAEEMDDDDGGSDSESDSENAIELLDHGKWPSMTLIDLEWSRSKVTFKSIMWWMISTKVMIWPFWKTKAWNSSLKSPGLCCLVRAGPFGEPWIRRDICLKRNYDSRTSHWEINSRRKGFMDRPSNTNFSVLKSTSKENSIHKFKWLLTMVTIMKSRVQIRP